MVSFANLQVSVKSGFLATHAVLNFLEKDLPILADKF